MNNSPSFTAERQTFIYWRNVTNVPYSWHSDIYLLLALRKGITDANCTYLYFNHFAIEYTFLIFSFYVFYEALKSCL